MKKSERNPSIQCSVCGQWKRLTGKDDQDHEVRRFYPVCGDDGEYEHLKPVCVDCCENHCPYNPKKNENELPILQ